MRLAIYNKGGGVDFYPTAQKAAEAVFGNIVAPGFASTPELAVDVLRGFTHIVCHLTSAENCGMLVDPSWPKLVAGNLDTVQVIIRVSSQGASGMSDSFRLPYRLSNRGTWILHLANPVGRLTESRWREIFRAINEWNPGTANISRDVAAIFDPHPESRLALRLLCEAWLMHFDMEAKHDDIELIKSSNELTVNSPVSPDQWFASFVGDFKMLDRESRGNAIEEIAAQMGGAASEVKRFFSELSELYWTGGENTVSWAQFEKTIKSLNVILRSADVQ